MIEVEEKWGRSTIPCPMSTAYSYSSRNCEALPSPLESECMRHKVRQAAMHSGFWNVRLVPVAVASIDAVPGCRRLGGDLQSVNLSQAASELVCCGAYGSQ